MSLIVLAFGSRPAVTPHDAAAIALLIEAIADPAGAVLAGDLRREASAALPDRRDVDLDEAAQTALFDALTLLRGQLLPDRLLTLRAELAATLVLGTGARRTS